MALHKSLALLVSILLATHLLASCMAADLICEDLPIDLCAFAVGSTGSRCLLEKQISKHGHIEYNCLTSEVTAMEFAGWVETDHCVQSCGINDRLLVGMSSDPLVEREFIKALCSIDCQGCANMVDFFEKLTAEEGVSLGDVCKAEASAGEVARREMGEVSLASVSANSINAWQLSPTPL